MLKRQKAPEESEWDAPFIYLSDDDDNATKKPTFEVSSKRNPRRINVVSSSDEETQTVKTEARQHTATRTVSVSCSSDRGIQLGDCYQSLIARGKTSIFAYSPLPTTNNLQNHAPKVVIDLEDENNPPILYPQSLSKIKTDISASKSCGLVTPSGQCQPVSLESHDPWKSIPDGFTTPQSSLISIATQSLSNRSKMPAKKLHKAKRTKPAAPVVLTQNVDSDTDGPKKKSQIITPAVPVVVRGPPEPALLRITNPSATQEIPSPPQQTEIACAQSAHTFVVPPVDTAPDLVSGEEMTLFPDPVIPRFLEKNRNDMDESKLSDPSPNELSDRIENLRLEVANDIPANDGDSSNPIAIDDTPLVSVEPTHSQDPKDTNIDEGNLMDQATQDSASELYLDTTGSQNPHEESEPEIIDSLHKVVSMTLSNVEASGEDEVPIKKFQSDTLSIDFGDSSETPKRIIRSTQKQAETPSPTNDQIVVEEDLSEIDICSNENSKEKEITNSRIRSSVVTQAESMSSAIEFQGDDLEDLNLSENEVQNLDSVNVGNSSDRINLDSSVEFGPLEISEREKPSGVDEVLNYATKVSPQCQTDESEAFLTPEDSSKTRRHETEGGESTSPGSENTESKSEKFWLTGTAVESMTKFLGLIKKADEASMKRPRDETDRGIICTRPAVRRKADGCWRAKNLSAVKARPSTRVLAAKKAQTMNGKTKPKGGIICSDKLAVDKVAASNDKVTTSNDEGSRGKCNAGKLGDQMVHRSLCSSKGVKKVVWVSCTGTPVYFSQNDYCCYYANY